MSAINNVTKPIVDSIIGLGNQIMPTVVEPFSTIIIEEEEHRNIDLMNEFIFLLIIKVLLLLLVSNYLWPKVMPNIMPGVNENPGFWNIFGLSLIIGLVQ